jgi:hypothetical protein
MEVLVHGFAIWLLSHDFFVLISAWAFVRASFLIRC